MGKNVLLIDNQDMRSTIATFNRKYGGSEVQCIWFNPTDKQFENEERDIDFEKALSEFEGSYLQQKIDVIGCDVHLHESNKTICFDFIKKIREYNKNCSLFVYSGALNKELLRLFQGEKKKTNKKAERTLGVALSSEISTFEFNRKNIPERIDELLKKPKVELLVENFLLQYQELEVTYSYPALREEGVQQAIYEIRQRSEKGVTIINEILEHSLNHMIKLNDL